LYGIAFTPKGEWLATGHDDGSISVWETQTGREVFHLQGHKKAVRGIAFSPDGRRLASGSDDWVVKLWDLSTGEERTLLGHVNFVRGLAFSPDGKRLATASADQAVKLWDVATGVEVLTLRGHVSTVWGAAFSPDGKLATVGIGLAVSPRPGGQVGLVKFWDGRPWDPEAALEREALGILGCLFAKPLSKVDVRDYLGRTQTIQPRAREMALTLVDRYREETDPEKYHRACWAVVRHPFANPTQKRWALSQAQSACRLAPHNGRYRTTLGVVYYRTGRYEQALAALTQAEALHRSAAAGLALPPASALHGLPAWWQVEPLRHTIPTNLAFLAMTHHQIGQKEGARAALARLRAIAAQPEWAQDEQAQRFLREAETLLGGKPAKPKG
jgi:hypothetical protein